MVSSEGLAGVDPWLYLQGFNVDSWLLPDSFSHDNDLLARALHTTATVTAPLHPQTLSPSAFFDSSAHTLSSNLSGGSDPEIVGGGAKRKRNSPPPTVSGSEGKATKRRSRASKKSQTTFITADPSNFRQMVQQVTGAKYIDDSSCGIFKPEPHRLVNRLLCGPSDQSTAVPTLDTSAFLSNHHQENLMVGNAFADSSASGLLSAKSNATVDAGGSAVDFDIYPTLESWKVM